MKNALDSIARRVTVPVFLGLSLAVLGATVQSLWADEAISYYLIDQPSHVFFDELLSGTGRASGSEPNQPAYYILLHGWTKVFGTSELSLRFPSILFFAATLIIVFNWVRGLEGRGTAFHASLLCAVSGYLIFFSQETRPYSMLTAVSCAAFYSYWRYTASDHDRRPLITTWIVSVLGGYTSILFFGVIAFMNVYFLMQWRQLTAKKRGNWLVSQALLALALIPVILVNLQRAAGGQETQNHAVSNVLALGYSLWSGLYGFGFGPSSIAMHVPNKFAVMAGYWPAYLLGAIVAAAALWCFIRTFRQSRLAPYLTTGLIVQLLFIGLLFTYINSSVLPRYLSATVPLIWIALAVAVKYAPRKIAVAVLASFLVVNLASVAVNYSVDEYRKEDYRALSRLIQESDVEGPTLFVGMLRAAIYYDIPDIVNLRLPGSDSLAMQKIASGDRFWLVLDRRRTWRFDPDGELEAFARRLGTPIRHESLVKLDAYVLEANDATDMTAID